MRVRGIVQDVVILLGEIARGGGRNHGLDFADGDVLDAGIAGEGAGRDARAEADAQHRFRIGMKQPGQMAHHALQLHVEGLGGGFDVAVDVDLDRAVAPARDGDRGVAALDGVEQLGIGRGDGDAATVGDHLAGNRVDARARECRRGPGGGETGVRPWTGSRARCGSSTTSAPAAASSRITRCGILRADPRHQRSG